MEHPIVDVAESVAGLEHGDVDTLVDGHLPSSARAMRQLFFEEHIVCICDADRADADVALTADDYTYLPQALFSPSGGDGYPGAMDSDWRGILTG